LLLTDIGDGTLGLEIHGALPEWRREYDAVWLDPVSSTETLTTGNSAISERSRANSLQRSRVEAYLRYCRSVDDLAHWAGSLGRFLLREGAMFCVADSNGPIPGLIGVLSFRLGSKIFQGPACATAGRPVVYRIGRVRPMKCSEAGGNDPFARISIIGLIRP
jgi:hypothetical protein